MHTSTLGAACTERINTTTARTSFNGGGAKTALAVTIALVNKTVNATSTPHQQRCWRTPTALLHHRHRLQLTSYIFSSQLHRVLPSSTSSTIFSSPASWCSTSTTTAGASSSPPEGIGYSFIATSSNDINTKAIHFPLATNKHSVDNQHFEGTCFREVWYISSKEGPNGHDYANSSTYNVEIRLQRQRLLHQRLQEQHMCKNILVQSLIDTVRT